MKILLIGSNGQLGREIIKRCPNNIDLITPTSTELDLIKSKTCHEFILDMSPDWIINSGAYTNVEKAELDKETAFKVNALGPKSLAKALALTNGKLLHISTDYVFSGKQNFPYKIDQNTCPINSYGISKAKGEEYIQKLMPENNQLCILRTSWLISPNGNNFATKMLKLLNSLDEIKVVYDQISSPTTTLSLANAIWEIIKKNEEYSLNKKIFPKINHFSNDGVASWYDLAVTIRELGIKHGFIKRKAKIIPIESHEYHTNALRPKYSVLDSIQTKTIINTDMIHWRYELIKAFEMNFSNKL
tara:strand:- start:517 stop:1422 length:906 start_codon:yes stop_codon:yes gene_type:complete